MGRRVIAVDLEAEAQEDRIAEAVRRQICGEGTAEDEALQAVDPRAWRNELASVKDRLHKRMTLTCKDKAWYRKYLGVSMRDVDACLRDANEVLASSNRRRHERWLAAQAGQGLAARQILLRVIGNMDSDGLDRVEAYAAKHNDEKAARKVTKARRQLAQAQGSREETTTAAGG